MQTYAKVNCIPIQAKLASFLEWGADKKKAAKSPSSLTLAA
jgi:hypothetical protein